MRAYGYTNYGGPENQRFLDLPKPSPGPGQLLVKVRAAGVNPADWKRRAGFRRQTDTLEQPVAHGLEVAGVVEETGPGTAGFASGDEVFGSVVGGGGFAEYALLSVDQTALKPSNVSFTDAATLPVAGATAYDGVQQLHPGPGEILLILGVGGGVGVAAAQIARNRGTTVVGTASEQKRSFIESLEVVHVPYGPGIADRVRAASPEGVHAIFDLIGGEELREVAGLVADKSRLISAADMASIRELGGEPVARARSSAVLQEVGRLVAEGVLKPHVTKVFSLDQADEALALVEGGHATGKVVLEVA
jgi:NADPH:quinone reductase-like Zn-dependent oxidoreductase